MSTGGHFNPLKKTHAHYSAAERHAGDLPALKADDSGTATLSVEVDVITVTESPTSIAWRGLIVHAQADDYKTQPTGNAGGRIACGVIQLK
jgi:Cu-Zn family superoxide dismutase